VALPLRALEAVVPFGLEVAAAHRSHPAVVHHPTCCKARVQPLCFCAETRLLTAVAGSRLLQRCWARRPIGGERLIVQSNTRCFHQGLSIDLGLRASHRYLVALVNCRAKLATEGGCQVNHAAVLEIQTPHLSAWSWIEGADARGLGDERGLWSGRRRIRHACCSVSGRNWR